MTRVGLDPDSVPHYYWKVPSCPPPNIEDRRLEDIVRDIRNKHPEVMVIWFDAFYILSNHGQMNNYVMMAEWLQRAGDLCDTLGLTIIGIVHSSKQRKGEEITDPRYSITGSVATGGFTSCQVIIEKPSLEDVEKRILHIYPRNAPEASIELTVDGRGCLQLDQIVLDNEEYSMENFFNNTLKGDCISLGDLCKWGLNSMKMSRATVKRHLDQLILQNNVTKVGYGVYAAVKHEYFTGPVAAEVGR
jgi:hypothetical protein